MIANVRKKQMYLCNTGKRKIQLLLNIGVM